MSQLTLRVSLGTPPYGCQCIHRIWHAYKNYVLNTHFPYFPVITVPAMSQPWSTKPIFH